MSDFTGVFYIFLWISYTQAEYFVSQDNSNWSGNKTCQIANRIEFDFSGDKITVNIPNLEVESHEKIWVGYFRKYTTFTYTGCVSINDVSEQRGQIQIEDLNRGKCFSACTNNRYIGITKDLCHCLGDGFTDTTNDLQVYCDSHCKSPQVACGGNNNGSTYLSVYRTSFNFSDSNKKDTNCLSLDPFSRKYMWMECSGGGSALLGMCAKDNHVFANKPTSYNYWLNTVNECFKNKSRPTDYSNSNSLGVHNGSMFWTGIIKSKAIYTEVGMKKGDTPNEGRIEFGYLKRTTGDNYELKFYNGDSNKRYLCSSDEGTVTKDSTSSLTVALTSTITSILSEGSVSYTTFTSSINDGSLNDLSTDSNVSVPVSISAVAIILLAVIVVIVTLKRRGKIQTRCCRNVQSDSSDYTTPEIHLAVQSDYTSLSPHYEQMSVVELPSTAYTDYNAIHDKNEHLYSDLEKHGGESYTNINIESHGNKY